MTKFKFGDKVFCIHGIGIVTKTYFDYEFDEFICEVVFILDNQTCTYKSLECELTKVSDWIPCSERMPKHGEMVLVFNGNSIEIDALAIGELDFECWCDSVTHWMPLPAPPQD